MVKNLALGTGRRKTSVARVFIRSGNGQIQVNGLTDNEYFHQIAHVTALHQPLSVTDNEGKYDICINVYGGGPNSQAIACRHGISRALCSVDASNRTSLKSNGFLTRDPRMVERKKYGQRGARRRFQFSKR